MLQETLKEFFPSWEHIRIQEEVIGFTCGLMKDPTPLVEHIYETFVEITCHGLSPGGFLRNYETERRLLAQGKDMDSTNLFSTLYTESSVPLFGHALYNQFVYINKNHDAEGEIVTPSKLYAFFHVSKANIPVTKFAEQDGSEESPECVLWIQEPDRAAIKSLLSTCSKISKRQPVTHLMIACATCKDLTHPEAITLSRNVQVVCIGDCDLPLSFWKKILHQLFDCVNLRCLVFVNTNLHQLEGDLDELFKNTGLTNQQVEVVLKENNFSKKFVKKWNGSSLGITWTFYDNFLSQSSDDEDSLG